MAIDGVPIETFYDAVKPYDARRWKDLLLHEFQDVWADATGRSPGDTADLTLRRDASQETEVLREVPVTRENHNAVFDWLRREVENER